MSEKAAIETIRALKRNAENDIPEYDYGWDAAIKALAALDAEKPGEVKTYRINKDGIADHSNTEYILLCDIQQFAASYHAEQCKECNDFCARAKEHCEGREAPLV